jgi:cytochrome c oxidase subunit 2
LELFWTTAPAAILVSIALPSFALLYAMEEKGDYHLSVKAIGHQWYWEYQLVADYRWLTSLVQFTFDSYMVSDDSLEVGQFRLLEVDRKLVLPVNTPIRVLTSSADVIHSWALPAAGVKMDAIPGRLNQVNLYFNRSGIFYGQCSELCGVNHGFMPICLKIVLPTDFNNRFLNSQ